MHRLISKHREEIRSVCEKFGVARLDVFGSAARGDDFDDAKSDADFLVEFSGKRRTSALDEFFGLRDELQSVLGRPVDLLEYDAVKNPYVRRSIDRTRETVYEA